MEKLVVEGLEGLKALLGHEIGTTDPFVVDQAYIDAFAKVTGDDQFIHVDPVRAAETPFGTTVVHGYGLLALAPRDLFGMFEFKGAQYVLNYGCGKVRFPNACKSGSTVRMTASLTAIDDHPLGKLVTFKVVYQAEGEPKPSCSADVQYLFVGLFE